MFRTKSLQNQILLILKRFLLILKNGLWIGGILHPRCHGLSLQLFEHRTKGCIVPIPTFESQLPGGEGTLGGDSIKIETHEILDAETINIGIVSQALTREVLR